MATGKVSVTAFVRASERYVASAVERANANGNAYLTKAEAAALPQDLRDNFANFRAGSGASTVRAAGFAEAYGDYVEARAAVADRNGDGYLTASESRRLPVDLQDNLANFAARPPPAPSGVLRTLSDPLTSSQLSIVRRAFADWVRNDLTERRRDAYGDWEYGNGSWAELVREYGGDGEHEWLRSEAIRMAETWSPSAEGWEQLDFDDDPREAQNHTGFFHFIRLFVELNRGERPRFGDEVD